MQVEIEETGPVERLVKVEIATAADRMRPRIRRRVEADAIEVF